MGLTIYITKQNLFPQVVKDVKSWFKTLGLNNFIPRGKLQVHVRYMAFIRFNIKRYNFIKEDKSILYPKKCEIKGKGV